MTKGLLHLIALGLFPTVCIIISNVIQLARHAADVQTDEIVWNGFVIALVVITSLVIIYLAAKESGATTAAKMLLAAFFSQALPLVAAVATVCEVRWTALSAISLILKFITFVYQIYVLIHILQK